MMGTEISQFKFDAEDKYCTKHPAQEVTCHYCAQKVKEKYVPVFFKCGHSFDLCAKCSVKHKVKIVKETCCGGDELHAF